jgi:hypothetical protein
MTLEEAANEIGYWRIAAFVWKDFVFDLREVPLNKRRESEASLIDFFRHLDGVEIKDYAGRFPSCKTLQDIISKAKNTEG